MTERQFPDLWVDPDDDPRDGGRPRGEKAVLAEYLEHFDNIVDEVLRPGRRAARSAACRRPPMSRCSDSSATSASVEARLVRRFIEGHGGWHAVASHPRTVTSTSTARSQRRHRRGGLEDVWRGRGGGPCPRGVDRYDGLGILVGPEGRVRPLKPPRMSSST